MGSKTMSNVAEELVAKIDAKQAELRQTPEARKAADHIRLKALRLRAEALPMMAGEEHDKKIADAIKLENIADEICPTFT